MDGVVFPGQSARACPGENRCAGLDGIVVKWINYLLSTYEKSVNSVFPTLVADNLLYLCLPSAAHRFIGKQAAFPMTQNAITARLSLCLSNGATHAASATAARIAASSIAGLCRPFALCTSDRLARGLHHAVLLLGSPRLVVQSCKPNPSLASVLFFCFTVFCGCD